MNCESDRVDEQLSSSEPLWTRINEVANQIEWVWSAFQALAVLIGFFFVVRQLRFARYQNTISVINGLRDSWNSEGFLKIRRQVILNHQSGRREIGGVESELLGFMDELGVLAAEKYVGIEIIWTYYAYYIDCYWLILSESISNYRTLINDSTWFAEFEELKRLSDEYTEKVGGLPAGKGHIDVFVKEELEVTMVYLSGDILA